MYNREIHSKFLFEKNQLPDGYFNPIIVAYDIKTPENIGSIIRLADNIACKKVLFVNEDDTIRISKIKKTAASSYNSVDWEFCKFAELENKIPDDYIKVGVETSSDSKNIYQTELPKKVAFIVGNEVSGIDNKLLDKCDIIIHIPIFGKNTSLNVAHALAISIFEWQKRMVGL